MKNISKKLKGFGALELILAGSIFVLIVVSVSGLLLYGRDSLDKDNLSSRASLLANEALSAIEDIRSISFSELIDGVHGLHFSGGQWSLLGESDQRDGFTRRVTISSISDNEKKVSIDVSWFKKFSRLGKISLTKYFTRWNELAPVSWWNNNWRCKQLIEINNSSTQNLSNYQTLLTINTASLINDEKLKSDCSDLRFIDSNETVELSYFLEPNTCNSTETKVWVKIPTIPNLEIKNIFLYYNNPLALSHSSAANTFIRNISDDSLVLDLPLDEGVGLSTNDFSSNNNHGTINNTSWTSGKFSQALDFNGNNSQLSINNDTSLNNLSEINISAWVNRNKLNNFESIISKAAYSLNIGADDYPYLELISGTETITDVGRIGGESYAQSLVVYNGKLYAGSGTNGTVYRYDGETTWSSLGRPGGTSNSYALSMVVFDGDLYVGTRNSGRVYRYDGGTNWIDIGRLGSNTYVNSLVVFNGSLYGGTYNTGRVYRYDGGTTWTDVGRLGTQTYVQSMIVYNNNLYAGSGTGGRVYRYDGGTTWTDIGRLASNTYVHSLVVFNGSLYGGAFNTGRVYRYDGGTTWTDIGRLGSETYVYSMAVYNGNLYAAGRNNARVYRYNGVNSWTDIGRLGSNTYALSMAVYDGKLYVGTFNSGRVYSIGNGLAVYSSEKIATNTWTYLSGSYDGSVASLYINNQERASTSRSISIANNSLDLKIGSSYGSAGTSLSSSHFSGKIDKIQIYNRALIFEEISDLYNGYGQAILNYPKKVLIRKYSNENLLTNFGAEFCLAEKSWWDNNWIYKRKIDIDNSTNSQEMTDYQILLNINTEELINQSKLNADCSDLRFVNSEELAELSFWIEPNTCNSTETKIWLKVPLIRSLSSEFVYLYYGNELANSVSSIPNTFIREINGLDPLVLDTPFDEDSGSIANDFSGNNNNGNISNANRVPGRFYQALNFNGSNSFVEVLNSPSLNMSSAISIAAWVKWNINPSSGAQWASIVNKNIDNQYRLHHNSSNSAFEFAIRTANNRWVVSNTSPVQDVWYFVVGTYDGSNVRIYVDGQLENSVGHSGALSNSSSNLRIGSRSGGDRFFNGLIDKVQIYNKALSSEEILDLYNSYGQTSLNYPGKVLVRKFYEENLIFNINEEVSYIEEDDSNEQSDYFSIDATNISASGSNVINIFLGNSSSLDLELSSIDLSWTGSPSSQLREIFIDDVSIWSGNISSTNAAFLNPHILSPSLNSYDLKLRFQHSFNGRTINYINFNFSDGSSKAINNISL